MAASTSTVTAGAHTRAQAPTSAKDAAVADVLEFVAAEVRRYGLAILRQRLADVVEGQLDPLTHMLDMQDPQTTDALLTADDLAARLRCNPRTLRRWRHLGWVPEPIMIGRAVRWRARDIERWEARRRR
jgi:predicted DNA-binding transcriptional regulator AlpA